MKTKLFALLLSCGMIFTGCFSVTKSSETITAEEPKLVSSPRTKDIAIIYTNDVHCEVEKGVGLSSLSALKKDLIAEGNEVLLVDAGDSIQGAPIGSMTKGEAMVDIMNFIGYDVAVTGNHEFDYGVDRFLELSKKAKYSYVASNFMDLTAKKPVLSPYVIKEVDGLKIAFVGVDTPKTITSSTPSYFQNDKGEYIYGFCQDENGDALYKNVQESVDNAKKDGADYVIALAHLGIDSSASPYMSTEVIAKTNGIDVVLDGHSHSTLECERVKNKDGKRVLLSSTGTKLSSVGMLFLSKEGNLTTGLIKSYAGKDIETENYIKSIMEKFDEELKKVVAKSNVDLFITDPATKQRIVRSAETNLGDLCADAYRIMLGADIGFINGGSVRCDLPAGDLTNGDIMTVNPFGNSISLVEATGAEILDALEMGVHAIPDEFGGFLQVSGLTYEIDTKIPSSVKLDKDGMFLSVDGEYRVKNVKINGENLDKAKIYTLASHDYLLKSGGDGMNMFVDNKVIKDGVMIDNELLIEYVKTKLNGVIGDEYKSPYGGERIIAIQ